MAEVRVESATAAGRGSRHAVLACDLPAASLLAVRLPFCRSCGADHHPDLAVCGTCGWSVAPLPRSLAGPIGDIHLVRQGARRQLAVRVGDVGDGATVRLMRETGEVMLIPVAELPPATPLVVDGTSVVRSAPGRILALARAVREGRVDHAWDPDELGAAAVAAASDQVTKRLLAVDALTLGLDDLVAGVGLSPSEQRWLRAVWAAAASDGPRLVDAVVALPAAGYRAKLSLLLRCAAGIVGKGIDVSALDTQLRPFLEEERLACLLHRVFGLSAADPAVLVADARWLARATELSEADRAAVDGGGAHVLAQGTGIGPVELTRLGRSGARVRALASLRTGRPFLEADDVGGFDEPLVDDLVDNGALNATTALARPRDAEAERYLRARLAPERLSDEEVAELGHDEEAARRAFLTSDLVALERFPDTPRVRHYRALAQLRRPGRAGQEPELRIDDVEPGLRPRVRSLLAAVRAAVEDRPVMDELTNGVLTDPSTWPVLVSLVGAERLTPSEPLAEQFPEICQWLALHHLEAGEAAVEALGRLMTEAPTGPMRVAAARRAVAIWAAASTESWPTSDGSLLPDVLRDPLRTVVARDPDLPLDDFRSFVALLATQDAAWLAEPGRLSQSPHVDSLEARFYVARARGVDDMLEVMAGALRAGDPPPWLFQARRSLRDSVLRDLLEAVNDPDCSSGALALAMREEKIVEGEHDIVVFTALGLAIEAYHLAQGDEEIADRYVAMLHDLRARWRASAGTSRDDTAGMVELATRRMAVNRLLARDREMDSAGRLFNCWSRRARQHDVDVTRLAPAIRSIADAARRARQDLQPWLAIVEADDVRRGLLHSLDMAVELEERTGTFLP